MEKPEMTIVRFEAMDIIATSIGDVTTVWLGAVSTMGNKFGLNMETGEFDSIESLVK